jgi:hypothetical protein
MPGKGKSPEIALRMVQVNDRAAEDFEGWFNGLREDQIIYSSPPLRGFQLKRR